MSWYKNNKHLVSFPETLGRYEGLNEARETFAYVPYIYAKQYVAKVAEDMKKMKNNHIRIVGEIDRAYRTIEDETQANIYLEIRTLYKYIILFHGINK